MTKKQFSARLFPAVCALAAGLAAAGGARAETWKHLTEADGLTDKRVQVVKRIGDTVWVGTQKGLTAFRGGKPTTVLTNAAAYDVAPAAEGRFWVGTGNGIVELDGLKVAAESMKGHSVGRVLPFGEKGFWAVGQSRTGGEVLEKGADGWTPVTRLVDMQVVDLFRARDGMMWVILDCNGVLAADPAKPPEEWVHHFEGFNITAFYDDPEDGIWLGTWGRGAFALEKEGAWTRKMDQEKAAVTGIRRDGKGQVWLATNRNGLWRHDGAQWQHHLQDEGSINLMETSADGRLWISGQTVCDLRVWNGEDWDTVLESDTLFNVLAEGPDGKIWVGNILNGVHVQP